MLMSMPASDHFAESLSTAATTSPSCMCTSIRFPGGFGFSGSLVISGSRQREAVLYQRLCWLTHMGIPESLRG